MRRRHQTGCGNELHSFCQSGIIKPPSVCSLQTGMADQLWHKQNSRLGAKPGTDYASAGCDWGREGTLRMAGFAFSPLRLRGPPPGPAWLPTGYQSLGDSSSTLGSTWLDTSARHRRHPHPQPSARSLTPRPQHPPLPPEL